MTGERGHCQPAFRERTAAARVTSEESNPFADPGIEVTLPTLFRIDHAEHKNLIRQVSVPPWHGRATLHDFKKSWMRGYTVVRADGSPQVLLLTNSAQPSAEWDYVMRLRGAQIDQSLATTELDLSSAKWVKHPAMQAALTMQEEYE